MSFELSSFEVTQVCTGRLIEGDGAEVVKGISVDSRTVKPGGCFIALKGTKVDGHNFISEAIRKGAKGVIFEKDCFKELSVSKKDLFLIEVSDTYNTIYNLARYKRGKFNFQILAVTGSNGKTTVKELCAEFLNSKFPTYKNHLNQNNLLGLSLNILNCSHDYKFAVFEIGISMLGEMARILDILKPDHGLITNIGPTHIQFLKEEHRVYEEKIKLFEYLKSDGYAFYSLDDKYLSNLKRSNFKCQNFVTFGFSQENVYWANMMKTDLSGTILNIRGNKTLNSGLLGRQNAFNILAAIAVASEFGVEFHDIKRALNKFVPPPGRMNHFSISGIDIIDDSYNSNPVSLCSALEFISSLNGQELKIAILGDMLELGLESRSLHYKCGRDSAGYDIDYYFCYGEEMQYFIAGLLDNGFLAQRVFYLKPQEISSALLDLVKSDIKAVLLFKASRGMRIESILEEFKNQIEMKHAL